MNRNKNTSPPQTSALLMLSSQEVGLFGVSEGNLPSLLAVPSADDKLLINDLGDEDSFVGQSPVTNNPLPSITQNSFPFQNAWVDNHSVPKQPTNLTSQLNYHQPSVSIYESKNADLKPSILPPPSFSLPVTNVSKNAGNQYRNTSKFQRVYPTDCYNADFQQQNMVEQNKLQHNSLFEQPFNQSSTPLQPDFLQTQQQNYPPPQKNYSQPQQNYSPPQQNYPPLQPPQQNFTQNQSQTVVLYNTQPQHTYQPIQPHWFYQQQQKQQPSNDNKVVETYNNIWLPFSHLDSKSLEEEFLKGTTESVVSVVGGRYEVDMGVRRRKGVFWEEEGEVRRATWFRVEGMDDGVRLVPCQETFANQVEEAYKNALMTSTFHERVLLQSGDSLVIHTSSTIISYPPSSPFQTLAGDVHGQVLKRGIEDVENIPEDECVGIEHVVLVVQSCVSRQEVINNVDALRKVTSVMTSDHFSREGVGRVEFLPVLWSPPQLQEDITTVLKRLEGVSMTGVKKLRHFNNHLLTQLSFFLSPSHAQQAAERLGRCLNETFASFQRRNPLYNRGVSIISHAITNLMMFELLSKQSQHPQQVETAPSQQQQQISINSTPTFLPNNNTTDSLSSICSSSEEGSLLEVLEKMGLQTFEGIFINEHIDLASLLLLDETDLKAMGLPLGPRKKILEHIRQKEQQTQKQTQIVVDDTREKRVQSNESDPINNHNNTQTYNWTLRKGGIDRQELKHTTINFPITHLFTLSSPIGLYLTLSGVESLGQEFCLPTCPAVFNVFHPFDSLAYRLEPFISPFPPTHPALLPHHKGRKRLHLEVKESVMRMGQDLKARLLHSFKDTWQSIHKFALAHKTTPQQQLQITDPQGQQQSQQQQSQQQQSQQQQSQQQMEMEAEVSRVLSQLHTSETSSSHSETDDKSHVVGALNGGRRVDYVLQEKTMELLNDHLFALTSPQSYWSSEDTALMMLKEIYLLYGIQPTKPSPTLQPLRKSSSLSTFSTPLSNPHLPNQPLSYSSLHNHTIPSNPSFPPNQQPPPPTSYYPPPTSNYPPPTSNYPPPSTSIYPAPPPSNYQPPPSNKPPPQNTTSLQSFNQFSMLGQQQKVSHLQPQQSSLQQHLNLQLPQQHILLSPQPPLLQQQPSPQQYFQSQ